MAPKKKQRTKKQKKKWFYVLASKEFKQQQIGETMAFEPENLVGRKVRVNLSNLAREMKRQNKVITFRITEVKEANALTEFYKYEIAPMQIKRLVRKERDKVDDSFIVETKDGTKVKIKPLLLTREHTQNSVKTALRQEVRKLLEKEAKSRIYPEFVLNLLSGSLQRAIKSGLKKVYPLALAEIRVMQKV